MRIFAANQFILDLNESSDKKGLYGAWVATSVFYKNLIKFGRFDEYHFFILPEDDKKHHFHKKLIHYLNDKRIRFKKVTQLPLFLKDAENLIFFTSSPGIFDIANLRSVYAKRYFPICGMTHTISYSFLLRQVFFYNLISDLQPFDSIVCTSRAVLESIKRIYKSIKSEIFQNLSVSLSYKARLDHLPLGINTEDYLRNNKKQSRQNLKLPAKKIIILYFGRFSIFDKADLYPLLFSFKNLLSKNKNVLLVLAGKNFQGNYGGKLKKIANDLGISNNVNFLFNPSQREKYLLYTASDIFVSPSDNLQESFGLTVLEAMVSGLPVVVSDWDGYKDIVQHNKTGFLIPTFWANCNHQTADYTYLFRGHTNTENLTLGQSVCVDIKKMTEYLNLLIKYKDLRSKLGSNAREHVLKNYDWSVVIPKYERLWYKLIDEARAYKESSKREPIFYPKYFEYFNHYPTYLLDEKTSIIITEEGINLLKTKRFPSGIPSLDFIIPQAVLLILFYLKERHCSSIREISHHIKKFFKEIGLDRISYHIMWMLKNYFIKVISK